MAIAKKCDICGSYFDKMPEEHHVYLPSDVKGKRPSAITVCIQVYTTELYEEDGTDSREQDVCKECLSTILNKIEV